MSIIGAPDEWVNLIDTLVPDVLNLIFSTLKTMPAIAPDAREDPTTEELCRRLRLHRDSARLPFRVDIQMVELDPEAGEDQGRMDIAFSPLVPSESIYFCLECKRLNVLQNDGRVRPYTAEYIRHGVTRFVKGQYSRRVSHGSMLGYVLDGEVKKAMDNVTGFISKQSKELKMPEPGEATKSSIFPQVGNLKETLHCRDHSTQHFTIHHIFMSGQLVN